MAAPTPVNGQITDASTSASANAYFTSLGSAPAVATATALTALAHAAGLAMLNAVSASQNWTTGQQATPLVAASKILAAGQQQVLPPAPGKIAAKGKS